MEEMVGLFLPFFLFVSYIFYNTFHLIIYNNATFIYILCCFWMG